MYAAAELISQLFGTTLARSLKEGGRPPQTLLLLESPTLCTHVTLPPPPHRAHRSLAVSLRLSPSRGPNGTSALWLVRGQGGGAPGETEKEGGGNTAGTRKQPRAPTLSPLAECKGSCFFVFFFKFICCFYFSFICFPFVIFCDNRLQAGKWVTDRCKSCFKRLWKSFLYWNICHHISLLYTIFKTKTNIVLDLHLKT